MADGFDRNDNDNNGGGSFVMGLLTGTVLGAGLGMLFAPKAGSDLRNQVREQAGNLANTASDGYRRGAETARPDCLGGWPPDRTRKAGHENPQGHSDPGRGVTGADGRR